LKAHYHVSGYPTLLVLKPDGTVLWKQVGYLAGGPSAMIAKLEAVGPRHAATVVAAPNGPAPAATVPIQWPAPAPRPPGAEPRLQAILYSSLHSSVILEGKNCEVGDTVDGMRVVKIARDKVTVEWNGETKELRIN
jgi:hypothetical protein